MAPKPSDVVHDAPPGAAAANPVAVGAAVGGTWALGKPHGYGRIRHVQCIRGQCHRRGKQPRHLGKFEAQGNARNLKNSIFKFDTFAPFAPF